MFDTIHLEPKDVPHVLRGSYTGNLFKARVVTEFAMPTDAGLWEGGSRDLFHAIEVASGRVVALPGQSGAPWDKSREHEHTYKMQPGIVIVCRSIVRGNDRGLTFYLHPDNAAKLLPPPAPELDSLQKLVLGATIGKKSHYAGKDRYQMTCDDMRWSNANEIPTRAQWDVAKGQLIALGLLDKRGAVTPKGRNAYK
jgi:hypothetical protein